MYYLYIIKSDKFPGSFYTGYTTNLENRLAKHNTGYVRHTRRYRPWALKSYIAFADKPKALAFERYLKSGSGRAFTLKRL